MDYDLQPGDLVRSNATVYNRVGEIRKPNVGLVIKQLMARTFNGSGLVKVFWPHTGNTSHSILNS